MNFIFSESYQLNRVKKMPRYKKASVSINKKRIVFIDSLSFFYQYRDIFQDKIYNFKSKSESPRIIDCGSNIGLSVIFFKEKYKKFTN